MTDQLLNRVTSDPRIMVGKPVTKGARIPVELILKMLAQGISKVYLRRKSYGNIPAFSLRTFEQLCIMQLN